MTCSTHNAVYKLKRLNTSWSFSCENIRITKKLKYANLHIPFGNSRDIHLVSSVTFFRFKRLRNPHNETINSSRPPTLHQRTCDKQHQQSYAVSLMPNLPSGVFYLLICFH